MGGIQVFSALSNQMEWLPAGNEKWSILVYAARTIP